MEPEKSLIEEVAPPGLEEVPKVEEVKTETPMEEQKPAEEQKPVKKERKKRKKGRKIPKGKGFPKFFKNPYIQYCEFMRPLVIEENKEMDPVEVTKAVAAKWYALSAKEREPFEVLAVKDKERFNEELSKYNSAHPEEPLQPKKRSKGKGSKQKESKSTPEETIKPIEPPIIEPVSVPKEPEPPKAFIPGTNCELPIFSEQFLEHNKQIESELKQLRKNCAEIEQQNAVLFKHVENMENGLQKVNGEVNSTRQRNAELEFYVTRLKVILASGFSSLGPVQSLPEPTATIENIAPWMKGLADLKTATSGASPIVHKAEKALRAMDLKFNCELRNFQH